MFQPTPPLPANEPATATLLVGDFESRCGNCNKPTLHGVHRHTDVSGWQPQPGGGCGARFVNIASLSRAVPAARLRELRPDLPMRAQHNDSYPTPRRLPRPDTAPTTTPDAYTTTVYMHRDNFDGHQHHHPLAAAHPDGSPLHLVFHASHRIRTHEDAADAAYTVGNHQGPDDNGQTWPSDSLRSVSTGDVIKVTGPDHWIICLRVDPISFTAVPEPTALPPLAGERITHRH
ncbi:hypothetical protein [Streptomyces lydicus]|uniref:hypothetical protein n=1 Tax=Streptomyces lydicus TaxID=47763 RepID=UPI0010109603|nr:hypothetical protein [Streptomyces lydicus]MCZ1011977.1 hypothetical protein [Streptomyces lydicus]